MANGLMAERAEIRKARIRVERLRRQKVETLAKAVRHQTYRIRDEDILEAMLKEVLHHRMNPVWRSR